MVDIEIGTDLIRTDHEGYSKLIDFYYRCCEHQEGSDILIDFNKLKWIDANMSALVVGMLKKMENERGFIFYIDEDDIKSRFGILITNGLITGVELVPRENMSALELVGFEVNEDVRFVEYIEKQLLSHEKLQIDEDQKKKLMGAFLELYTNIQKHARTKDQFFVCGQYYATPKVLSFTLVDIGVGFLAPIKEHTNGEIKTSNRAISWALKKGNTTGKDSPGGLGLKEILDFCKKTGATFEIVTGNTYWSTSHKAKKIRDFCGTTVNVIFNCSAN